jgi:predicted TPR repeat methyltransferase
MDKKPQQNELESLFTEAVAFHQGGELEKACGIYSHILEAMHDSPLVNYNLGLVLFELDRYEESYQCYAQALKVVPEEIDVLYNSALCLKKLGRFDETIRTYKKILSLHAEEIDSIYNLACCYRDMHDDDKAIALYLKVLTLDRNHPASLNNLAFLYHRKEDYSNAEKYYCRLLELRPEHQAAKHMLSSIQGEKCKSPPPQYIREIFDNYAARYDTSLVSELNYSVPQKLRQIYDQLNTPEPHSLAGLDLGCGTGLGGEAFAGICSTFTGVDISQKMVDRAAAKNIYSELHVSEIHDFLKKCPDRFTLIVATDVFGYIGDLQQTLEGLYSLASPGAHLCFSTEHSDDSGYTLRTSGRFAHSLEYINLTCHHNGWTISSSIKTQLRKEKGRWIEGMLYIVRK